VIDLIQGSQIVSSGDEVLNCHVCVVRHQSPSTICVCVRSSSRRFRT
jgi:hypothetical protein